MSEYGLSGYGAMLADATRREAYAEALRRTVGPESSVLEIGTGPGIFAMVAARLGARAVVGIDRGAIIALARELAAANGLADTVRFERRGSVDYEPTARFDIVLTDLRGVLPINGDHFAAIADARQRLLQPDGVLIPARDRLWAAVARDEPAFHHRLTGFEDRFGLDLTVARERAGSSLMRVDLAPEQLMTAPAMWAEIDYQEVDDRPVGGTIDTVVTNDGVAHGIALWFDTDLIPGVGFDAAPGAPPTLYRQMALPFPRPVDLARGDRVRVALDARRAGGDYAWRWQTVIGSPDAPEHQFDQSTLDGLLIDPDRLRRRAASFRPLRSTEGEMHRFVLAQMDGCRDLRSIAHALADRFPAFWRGSDASPTDDALAFVADLTERFG